MQSFEQFQYFLKRQTTKGCWQQYCERSTELRQLGTLGHLRQFQVDEEIYNAVVNRDLGSLRKLRDFNGHLTAKNYCDAMKTLIKIEEAYNSIIMRQYDITEYIFEIKVRIKSESRGVEYIDGEIKGLSKLRPPLEPGDIVLLENMQDCLVPPDGEPRRYFQGDVTAVYGDVVRLACRYYANIKSIIDEPVNISFISRGKIYSHYERAIDKVRDSDSMRNRILRRGKTPDSSAKISIKPESFVWADERLARLNDRQRKAVRNILAGRFRPRPHLLIGLPGTGKTHTLIETAAQIYVRERTATTLLCAKSGTCVDLIIDKLVKLIGETDRIVRFSRDAEIADLASESTVVTTSIESSELMDQVRFDYVLIDDACTTSELDTLMPICSLKDDGCLVLAGDREQVSPIAEFAQLAEFGFGRSLFDRMLKSNNYCKKNAANRYEERFVTNLTFSYRNHPRLMVSNRFLRDNQLDNPSQIRTNMDGFIQFHNLRRKPTNEYNSTSWINDKEAEFCVDLIFDYVVNHGSPPHQIGVMTASKAQAQLIMAKLDRRLVDIALCLNKNQDDGRVKRVKIDGYNYCKVDSVEGFQGDEREIIIMSTVRSWSRCCEDFIVEARLFNLAMSRAKDLLVVVGDQDSLKYCPCWREFLRDATRFPPATTVD